MNAILSGLAKTVFVKAMHCETAKEIWDKLKNIYEGDDKVKEAKLQTYRGQFENLKMKEEENIVADFLRADETVNIIRGLGERTKESVIVQKILRSLPMRFDSKISAIEERSYLETVDGGKIPRNKGRHCPFRKSQLDSRTFGVAGSTGLWTRYRSKVFGYGLL
jgi:hypothetical protein